MSAHLSAKTLASAGFTLLEILVALTVLGFLLAALSQGTRFGMSAWSVQTRIIAAREELEAVDRTLRQLVQQMDTGTAADSTPLIGGETRLAFVSRLPMAVAEGRLASIVLAVNAAHRLEMLWRPHMHAIGFSAPPPLRGDILLRDVARLEVGYWSTEDGSWLKSWSRRDMPALIRLRILFPKGDARHWPDIVAAPMKGRRDGYVYTARPPGP